MTNYQKYISLRSLDKRNTVNRVLKYTEVRIGEFHMVFWHYQNINEYNLPNVIFKRCLVCIQIQ